MVLIGAKGQETVNNKDKQICSCSLAENEESIGSV
jgi:hypothetical protein